MRDKEENETLDHYLETKVFAGEESVRIEPNAIDAEGFDRFIECFKAGLAVERAAVIN